MSIITPSIFIAEIAIPQKSNYFENGGNLQEFIDKYEKKFLLELFGVVFYNEFIAGLALPNDDPEKAKWLELRDETDLKAMIANYVYTWYKRNETTNSTGLTEAKAKTENATPTNSIDKQVRAWNEMVDMVRLFDLSTTTYPNWVRKYWMPIVNYYSYWRIDCGLPRIYFYDNSLGF